MLFIQAINSFFQLLIYLILGRAIASWFIRPGDRLYPLYLGLLRITEPILAPCRRLTGRFGMASGIDFSPIVALLLLSLLNSLLIRILSPLLLGGGL